MKNNTTTAKFILGIIIIIAMMLISKTFSTVAGTGDQQTQVYVETENNPQLTADNPYPMIQTLNPDHTNSGGTDFILQILGQEFITSTIVSWNNFDRPTTYISTTLVQATIYGSDIILPGIGEVVAFNPPPGGGESNTLIFVVAPNYVYLPLISNYYPPIPFTPTLNNIDNSILNHIYSVSWSSTQFAAAYRLQEATNPGFNDAVQVYDGTGLTWSTPNPGKPPGTYYYRLQSYNSFGSSDWSLPRSVTSPPTDCSFFICD